MLLEVSKGLGLAADLSATPGQSEAPPPPFSILGMYTLRPPVPEPERFQGRNLESKVLLSPPGPFT